MLVGCDQVSDLKLLRILGVMKGLNSEMLPEELWGCNDISTRPVILLLADKFKMGNP